jgi:partner of Y14 and mago
MLRTNQNEIWFGWICFDILQIRLAEAQLQGDPEKTKPETMEKMKKIEGWREELKLLEDNRAPAAS